MLLKINRIWFELTLPVEIMSTGRCSSRVGQREDSLEQTGTRTWSHKRQRWNRETCTWKCSFTATNVVVNGWDKRSPGRMPASRWGWRGVVGMVRQAQYRNLKSIAGKRARGGEGARGKRQKGSHTQSARLCVQHTKEVGTKRAACHITCQTKLPN